MIILAIQSLRPKAQWVLDGDDYEGLDWRDKVQTKPTKQEVEAEIQRLIANNVNAEYKHMRQYEYPPISDYIDGVVKGDQAQIDAYIAACQAVKAKYPKP